MRSAGEWYDVLVGLILALFLMWFVVMMAYHFNDKPGNVAGLIIFGWVFVGYGVFFFRKYTYLLIGKILYGSCDLILDPFPVRIGEVSNAEIRTRIPFNPELKFDIRIDTYNGQHVVWCRNVPNKIIDSNGKTIIVFALNISEKLIEKTRGGHWAIEMRTRIGWLNVERVYNLYMDDQVAKHNNALQSAPKNGATEF